MATDLVCGMKVHEKTAESATYQGQTYYFCSTECKKTFTADPAKHVKQPATAKP